MDAAADGADGAAGSFGGILVGQALDLGQDNGLAEVVREFA